MTIETIVPNWPAPGNIKSAVTLRFGGVSNSPYEALNLAEHVGDNIKDIARNRELLKNQLQLPESPHWLTQTHSATCLLIDDGKVEGDAMVSAERGRVLAVMTADCLPILVSDQEGSRYGVIHAGWRGLASGIIGNTLAKFEDRTVIAWLGPAIGPCHYEIGLDVYQHFPDTSVFLPGKDESHWLMDLYAEARRQLVLAGVNDIYGGGFCSYCEDRFYSYRRDGATGRFAALIWS